VTKTDEAYLALRTLIEEGTLAPDTRLVIDHLRMTLTMSPTPIREALRLLQAEGLVRHEPYRGMVVVGYDLDRALEVYEIRMVLEPMATRRAAVHASTEDVAAIRDLQARLDDAVMSHAKDAATLNAQWHQSVYRASHSSLLEEAISRLWSALPNEIFWVSGQSTRSTKEHQLIVGAIAEGDADRAELLMRAHIQSGVDRVASRFPREAHSIAAPR
jgi:DNA-binding GntR family transcriptional regulator